MTILRQLFCCSIFVCLALLIGCTTDPLANITSRRTIVEVEPKIHADMPLIELLSFTESTPVLTQRYTHIILADGDLWIVEGRDAHGTVTIKDWKFEKR